MAGSPLDLFPEVDPAAVQTRLDYRRKHSGKTCAKCREAKPLSAFGVHSKEPDGLRRECKQCTNAAQLDRDRGRVNG